MVKPYTEQIFRTSYKDDFKDSDNYHRILFNSGRALQARELTQLQTIIQSEIERFASNIFVDGAPVNPGGMSHYNDLPFIKIAATTPLPADKTTLRNVILTGGQSGLKVKVVHAIAADTNTGDPETLYVQYLDAGDQADSDGFGGPVLATNPRVTPGETLTGNIGLSAVAFDVQTTNTSTNPAIGLGNLFEVNAGSFYVQGHFVFNENQIIVTQKYAQNFTGEVGFKVTQDIVTSSDNEALFDNQGATPNRSSPGADRYRIRLTLIKKTDLAADENYVRAANIYLGVITSQAKKVDGFNSVKDFVAVRNKEISGNFIKKYFKANFTPNDDDTFKLKVTPGTAYINGYRVDIRAPSTLLVDRPKQTYTFNNESVPVDYGNYFVVSNTAGGQGMPDFGSCEEMTLYDSANLGGTAIGTCRARAITEWQNGLYKLHVFNIRITTANKSSRDVRSFGSAGTYYNNYVANNQTLFDTKKKKLMFDLPFPRPQSFSDMSVTGQRVKSGTADGSGNVTITLTSLDEAFTNTGDWVIASSTDAFVTGWTVSVGGGGNTATISGLSSGTIYEIATYVRKSNATIRSKTLQETTTTATLDSDGNGNKYIELGKSDIYQLLRVRKYDSDGDNIFGNFILDTGLKDTHYDDGRLIYKNTGLDSDQEPVFVRYKYFEHGNGDFFAVNSYTGQVNYRDIPVHRTDDGRLVSLRDVVDFRPATNGSGSFNVVNELPQPSDLVSADVAYYVGRKDKLILSQNGELRYLQGVPELDPSFPTTPVDCIDLYKFHLEPFTLHTKDLKSRLLPMKGYTMEDIGKLDKRIDKVEEMATLSLLELSTLSLQVQDSNGLSRTKSGFFVDNFANHLFSDTKNVEYRASLDPQEKLLRPSHRTHNIDLFWDSAQAAQDAVTKKGDLILLDYTEVNWLEQPVASRTENLNPFHIEKIEGHIDLSPASDHWRETEIAAPHVIDQGAVLDTSQAVLWNSHQWDWGGVDINDLQVGATSSQVTGTNTTTTVDVSTPRITGVSVNVSQGEWVVTGTTSNTESLGTQSEIVSQGTEEFVTTEVNGWEIVPWGPGDVWEFGQGGRDTFVRAGVGGAFGSIVTTTDTVTTTDIETREQFETVTNTSLAQTTTTSTDTEWTTDTTTTTSTSTTTTVNRVAGEHTIRETVGTNVIDVLTIPFMRSRVVSFRGTGLRPNTRYFPFFDQTYVGTFIKGTTDFERISQRNPEFRRTNLIPSVGHSEDVADALLLSDANGTVTGEFEIPNNSAMRFQCGTREFALIDISVYNKDESLSFATALYDAVGHIDVMQDTVHSTRVLEIVGESTTVEDVNSNTESTVTTSNAITSSTATDIQTESTITETVTNTTETDTVTDVTVVPIPPPVYSDPLAQTFSIDEQNGIFATEIEVYFATKDAGDIPVQLQLRPVVNGVPSAHTIVPGSTVFKTPAQVTAIKDPDDVNIQDPTTAEMLANGTTFKFDEPIFLKGRTEYAIVLISASMEYKVFISHVTDFELGSTEKRIAKQPYLGSLFKSQNSTLWEPSQDEDLAFKIKRADFVSQGNAYLENVNVPPLVLSKNPFRSYNGSNTITVINKNHGLRYGDKTKIFGLDSSTTYNGILGSDIMGERLVTRVDGTAFQFAADSSANADGRFGGGKCTAHTNMTFEIVNPTIMTMKPETTNITMVGKFLSQSSLVDSADGRFSQSAAWQPLKNGSNYYFDAPRMIANRMNEADELGVYSYPKSSVIRMYMTTTDSRVSPVIDMQRAGLTLVGNLIDKQDSAATNGFNVPISWVDERHPFAGTHLAKHVTIPVTLEQDAIGLKIILAANRHPSTDFDVYYKTTDAESGLLNSSWVPAYSDNTMPTDTNPSIYREYRYTIGGFGDTNNTGGTDLTAFRKFQVKIVFKSTNSAKVPIVRDLRVIAVI
jgi:hypothetical protein